MDRCYSPRQAQRRRTTPVPSHGLLLLRLLRRRLLPGGTAVLLLLLLLAAATGAAATPGALQQDDVATAGRLQDAASRTALLTLRETGAAGSGNAWPACDSGAGVDQASSAPAHCLLQR